MAGNHVDYTRLRLRAGQWAPYRSDGKIIAKCPKCGRKGAMRGEWQSVDGEWMPGHVTHAFDVDVAPFPHRLITDRCFLPLSDEAKTANERKRAEREQRRRERAERAKQQQGK